MMLFFPRAYLYLHYVFNLHYDKMIYIAEKVLLIVKLQQVRKKLNKKINLF